jgi:hypothetical protein
VVGYFFYHLLQRVGFGLRAITALQILNALLSATAAIVLFSCLKAAIRSLYLTTFLTLLFALSATWWKFSTDADAYIISVVFILIAFRFILPAEKPRPFLVALFYSVSMCFHELAIFFGPVAIVGLLYQNRYADNSRRVRVLLQFALVSIVTTAAAYFSCFYLTTKSLDPRSFMHWVTYYSPDASFTFNIWNDLVYTIRGHFRLFLSGRFNLLQGLLRPMIVLLIALLVIDLCVLLYLVVSQFRLPKLEVFRSLLDDARGRALTIVSAVWFLIYLVFLFVWLPQNTFYRLFYLPALIVLVGLFAWARFPHGSYQASYRLLTLTIAVALGNFLFFIFPYSHAEKFPPTLFALQMNEQWKGKTLIYYSAENSDNSLVRYFAPNTTWVQITEPEIVENEMKMLSPSWNVWLETTAIDRLSSTPEGAEWLRTHEKPNSRCKLKDKGFRIEFVQLVE